MTSTAAARGARVALPRIPSAGLSAATGGAFVLGSTGLLSSDAGGFGTCLFAAATGLGCPFCGLTHGVAALGAGDIAAAIALNPLAPLAVGLAAAVAVTIVRRRTLTVPAAALWALAATVVLAWLGSLLL